MQVNGIIPAMVTPLMENGEINEEVTCKLVNHLIDSGVHGLFILGTNGEFYSLTEKQKLKLVQVVVHAVNGRVPVYAGAGAINTDITIDLANKMKHIGVDAVSIITPFLVKLREEEIYLHYKKIAEDVDLPIILYNIPKNTGINISSKILERLKKYKNIVGIKDSSGDIDNMKDYIEVTKDTHINVLVGSDSLILESLKLGAAGAVAATANILTKTDLGIYRLFHEGNIEDAAVLQNSINSFRRVLKFNSIPTVLKYSLRENGFDVGYPCLPIKENLTKEEEEKICRVLAQYQEIEKFEGDRFAKT